MPEFAITVRPIRGTDINFIFATWLRHLWFSSSNETTLPKDTFMRLHHARIDRILKADGAKIACLKEDPDVILGYQVGDFIYFKKAWRGLGFEKILGDSK